jgi:hypothetical protein
MSHKDASLDTASTPITKIQSIPLVPEKSTLHAHEHQIWSKLFEEAKSLSKSITKAEGKNIESLLLHIKNDFVFVVKKPKDDRQRYFYFHGTVLLLRLTWIESLANLTNIERYKDPLLKNTFVFNDIDPMIFEAYYEYIYTLDIKRDVFALQPKEFFHAAVYIKDPNFMVYLFDKRLPKLMEAPDVTSDKSLYELYEKMWNFFQMILNFEKYQVPSSLQVLYVLNTLLLNKTVAKKSMIAKGVDPKKAMRSPDDFFMPGPVISTDTIKPFCGVMTTIVFELLRKASVNSVKANYSKIQTLFDTLLFFGTVIPKLGEGTKSEMPFVEHWQSMIMKFPMALIDENHFMSVVDKFKPFNPNIFPKKIHFMLCHERSQQMEKEDDSPDEDFIVLSSDEDDIDEEMTLDDQGVDVNGKSDSIVVTKKKDGSKNHADRSLVVSKPKRKHAEIDLRDNVSEDEEDRKVKHIRTKEDRDFVEEDISDDESFVEEESIEEISSDEDSFSDEE